jgi:hypothetical protein
MVATANKVMTLTTGEFIRRFLIHVLPHGIRHYGLLASGTRADNIARARELLNSSAPQAEPGLPEVANIDEQSALSHPCPCCGGAMVIIETFQRGSSPRYRPAAGDHGPGRWTNSHGHRGCDRAGTRIPSDRQAAGFAVTSPTRLTAAPELPIAGELGFPGMTVTGSIGLLAPTGTPIEIIEQIAQATRMAVAEPTYRQMLIDAGMEAPLDSNPETFRQSLAADVALWAPVVKSLELKLD